MTREQANPQQQIEVEAQRYEECLLAYKQDVLESNRPRDAPGVGVARSLTIRAALGSVLHSVLVKNENEDVSSSSSSMLLIGQLEELLQQTHLQIDQDASGTALPVQRQLRRQEVDAFQSFLGTIPSTSSTSATSAIGSFQWPSVSDQVDTFFRDYPTCGKQQAFEDDDHDVASASVSEEQDEDNGSHCLSEKQPTSKTSQSLERSKHEIDAPLRKNLDRGAKSDTSNTKQTTDLTKPENSNSLKQPKQEIDLSIAENQLYSSTRVALDRGSEFDVSTTKQATEIPKPTESNAASIKAAAVLNLYGHDKRLLKHNPRENDDADRSQQQGHPSQQQQQPKGNPKCKDGGNKQVSSSHATGDRVDVDLTVPDEHRNPGRTRPQTDGIKSRQPPPTNDIERPSRPTSSCSTATTSSSSSSAQGLYWGVSMHDARDVHAATGTIPRGAQRGGMLAATNSAAASSSSSWAAHPSSWNQNPFQTAREYARVERQSSLHGNGGEYMDHPYQTYNQHPNNYNTYHNSGGGNQDALHLHHQGWNPYVQTNPFPPQQEQREPAPEQPAIRESLKRKFQPPKRAPLHEANSSNFKGTGGESEPYRKATASGVGNQRSTTSGAVKRGSGVLSRPPTTTATTTSATSDEDDDLPDELKRFGKDLVEKIESEIMDCGDSVTFDDIAGLEDAKQTVQEVVCWPMKRPDLFTGLRRAPNGLLLYGPPGTGKTLIGKAIAHESGATFFSISSSSLTSKWIGEGEKLVRTLFAVAAYREPSVVFIDEIDSLLTQRKADENEASRRIKTEFLVQLDGTGTSGQGRVLVIGATNRPQELDEAARRRFTKRLYIPLPEKSDRQALLEVLLATNNHCLHGDEIHKLAIDTTGFSGADLKALCTDAAMGPIRQLGAQALQVNVQDIPPIAYKHFRQALRGMTPSVAPADLDQYVAWDRTYGTKRAVIHEDDDDDV